MGQALKGVPETRWIEECDAGACLCASDKRKSRNLTFRRAFKGLLDNHEVASRGDFVWLTR